jgi:hypothetical protein
MPVISFFVVMLRSTFLVASSQAMDTQSPRASCSLTGFLVRHGLVGYLVMPLLLNCLLNLVLGFQVDERLKMLEWLVTEGLRCIGVRCGTPRVTSEVT